MIDRPFMSPNDSPSRFSLRSSEAAKQSETSVLDELEDRGRQILIMNVDIGDGRTDEIVVHECDEPEELAKAFCEKYGLAPRIRHALSMQIESNIEQLVEDHVTYVDESPKKVRPYYDSPVKTQRATSNYRTPQKPNRRQPSFGDSYTDQLNLSSPSRISRNDSIHNHPGPRLYEKGLIMKKIAMETALKKLKEREEQESIDLTFTPSILRRVPAESNITEASGYADTDRLRNREQKLNKMREEQDYQQRVVCTFKPEICEASRELMKNRSTTASERLDQLYNEAKKIEERRKLAETANLKTLCSFKPEIIESPFKKNPNSTSMSPLKLRRPETSLRSSGKTNDQECSFKPKTGRPPKFNRNADDLPIGQYLITQMTKRESPDSAKLTSKMTPYAGENSLKIVDKLCFNRYEQIYWAFCIDRPEEDQNPPNPEPEIEAERLAQSKDEGIPAPSKSNSAIWDLARAAAVLDSKLLKVIAPFIEELAKSSDIYDLTAFSKALDNFVKKLSPIEKSTIYSTGKSTNIPEPMPFKPKITNYSSQTLKMRTQVKMYDRMLSEKQRTQSKLKEKQDKKKKDEMSECTFYPNTLTQRPLISKSKGIKKDTILDPSLAR